MTTASLPSRADQPITSLQRTPDRELASPARSPAARQPARRGVWPPGTQTPFFREPLQVIVGCAFGEICGHRHLPSIRARCPQVSGRKSGSLTLRRVVRGWVQPLTQTVGRPCRPTVILAHGHDRVIGPGQISSRQPPAEARRRPAEGSKCESPDVDLTRRPRRQVSHSSDGKAVLARLSSAPYNRCFPPVVGTSFNGRTPRSGRGYWGSNPLFQPQFSNPFRCNSYRLPSQFLRVHSMVRCRLASVGPCDRSIIRVRSGDCPGQPRQPGVRVIDPRLVDSDAQGRAGVRALVVMTMPMASADCLLIASFAPRRCRRMKEQLTCECRDCRVPPLPSWQVVFTIGFGSDEYAFRCRRMLATCSNESELRLKTNRWKHSRRNYVRHPHRSVATPTGPTCVTCDRRSHGYWCFHTVCE